MRINIIDTPGHVDFTAEVEMSLRVLDGGVIVLDASSGVQSQTETVWRQANKYQVPLIAFSNKMDVIGADFHGTIQSARDKLGANALAYNLPIGRESDFKGVVDLLTKKAYIWEQGDTGAKFQEAEVPADMKVDVEVYREKLVEEISGTDDVLMAKYLGGEEISVEELKIALRKAVIDNKIVPVLAGSSLRNKGVQPMLDSVIEYLPSPQDIGLVLGKNPKTGDAKERKTDPQTPLAALGFLPNTNPISCGEGRYSIT